MLDFLKIIYLDYYNIQRTLDLHTDKEVMNFLAFILKNNNYNDISKSLESFKNDSKSKILEQINKNEKDMFFVEKNFVHLTYPLSKTLDRIDILYKTLGSKLWNDIFGFEYSFFNVVIRFIIFRVLIYNDYYISKDATKKAMYEKEFANSKKFYFTRKEFYSFFPNNKIEIDKILSIISKKATEVSSVEDTYYFLEYNNKFILYFMWDFIYNLYDILEDTILKKINSQKYYKQRGKVFEEECYKVIKSVFMEKVYNNLVYYDELDNNHEIDCLVESENEYIIFEFKSSKFDISKTENNNELKKYFIRAYSRGYKTLNDFNDFVSKRKQIKMFDNNKKIYNFDLNQKNIIYIHVSLYNIDYLQTSVQKIDKNLIKPVNIYPINLNYIDFLTIFSLAKNNYALFIDYLNKRYNIINQSKMLTLDIDEIDAFGFLTDLDNENNYKAYEILMKNCNTIDTNFMISNGTYREQVNDYFDKKFFAELLDYTGEIDDNI